MEPKRALRDTSTASTLPIRENGPPVVDTSARRESGGPVDNSAQRVQSSRASGGNVVMDPVIRIPQGSPERGPRQNPDRAGQQLPPPEVAHQLQYPAQMPDNRPQEIPLTSLRYPRLEAAQREAAQRQAQSRELHVPRPLAPNHAIPRYPLPPLEADQRQPHPVRELAAPRSPAQNRARDNPPLEVGRNQLIENPPSRDSAQRSQRNIAVVQNDGLQGRHLRAVRDFLQPPRAEINPDMAQLAHTFIPIIESILALSQNIVWVLSLLFFFVVLVLIISRIVRFFFPLDTITDSPRLLFRLVGSGYSNAATIYEMVFPLSISNPFLFIAILLGAIVVTRIIAYCVEVSSTSPRC